MRCHSKRKSPQNWLFSDPTPPSHHLSLVRLTHPSPHVTGEIVANIENSSTKKHSNKVMQCNVSRWVNEQNRLSIVLTTRIDVSTFRNSFHNFFLNEPSYFVLILIFLPPVVHDIQIESPWPHFEMMTLQHGAWISRFKEKSFINKYFT